MGRVRRQAPDDAAAGAAAGAAGAAPAEEGMGTGGGAAAGAARASDAGERLAALRTAHARLAVRAPALREERATRPGGSPDPLSPPPVLTGYVSSLLPY